MSTDNRFPVSGATSSQKEAGECAFKIKALVVSNGDSDAVLEEGH